MVDPHASPTEPPRSTSTVDVPIELTMVDGSKWIVYYRLETATASYNQALQHLRRDIDDGCLIPADDLDRVQRGWAQVNMLHVVSVRDPDWREGTS